MCSTSYPSSRIITTSPMVVQESDTSALTSTGIISAARSTSPCSSTSNRRSSYSTMIVCAAPKTNRIRIASQSTVKRCNTLKKRTRLPP